MLKIGSTLTIMTVAAALAAALVCQPVSPAAAAGGRSCNQTAGPARAATYVSQCTQVSPATRPPCNAANSCALIISEIRRSCALIGAGAPSFCAAYRN